MKTLPSAHPWVVLVLLLIWAFVPLRAHGKTFPSTEPQNPAGQCPAVKANPARTTAAAVWNGWGVDLANTRFQPAAQAGLTADQIPHLRLKWAFGFKDATMAFSQPAIAGGRLFVGSESGVVYALDPASGCTHWTFQAKGAVRTGFAIGPGKESSTSVLYFGDQHGGVFALGAASGELLWKAQADPHPAAMITGTPQLWKGHLYVPVASYEENFSPNPHYECCTFRGSVVALDATTGKLLWQTYTVADAPQKTGISKSGTQLWGASGAAVWSAPTLDPAHRALYVATGNNYSAPLTKTSDSILAIDLDTGKIRWTQQMTPNDAYNSSCETFLDATQSNCPPNHGSDFDFGSSPILVVAGNGRQILVASQKSGIVYGLDPAQAGKVIWQTRIGKGGSLGGIEWGSAADREKVYAALSDCNWKTYDRVRNGQKISEVDMDNESGGGLFALRLSDGQIVWQTSTPPACADREHCSPAQLAAVTALPGAILSGSLDGHLRAYASQTGKILWDFNTALDFHTVNGVPAHGGSINGPGAVVVGGMLYVNSGYSRFGEAGGNVFLAFSVDGK